jgi:hypothetical protein
MPASAATWRYSLCTKCAREPSAEWNSSGRSGPTPKRGADAHWCREVDHSTARSWSLGVERPEPDLVVEQHGGEGDPAQHHGADGQSGAAAGVRKRQLSSGAHSNQDRATARTPSPG